MAIGGSQIEEEGLMVEQVKAVRVDGVDSISWVDVAKGGDGGANVGDIGCLVRLIVEERLVSSRRDVLVEDFKLVIVRVPEKLALDYVRKAVDDAVVVAAPHLNAVTAARGDVTEDLYLNGETICKLFLIKLIK